MSDPLPLAEASKRLRRPGGRPRKAPRAEAAQASAPPAAPLPMRGSAPAVPELCPSTGPRLLDLAGAAAYLGVSTWTIRDWAAAGIVRRVRLPGSANSQTGALHRVLFDVRDLDRLVEISKAGAEADPEGR